MHNNVVNITGIIDSAPELGHTFFETNYYIFYINVNRLSNNTDRIPVMISSTRIDVNLLTIGTKVNIKGDYRSFNYHETGSTHLFLNVFANYIKIISDTEFKFSNEIFLNGYLCKQPIFRKTPLNRTVCDILLAVNRKSKKSDYVPCILWGKDAEACKSLAIGTNITLNGRIQSRVYQKKTDSNSFLEKTAYEISASTVNVMTNKVIDSVEE